LDCGRLLRRLRAMPRETDARREFAVAPRFAIGDVPQGVPDFFLEGGARGCEGQIEGDALSVTIRA